MGLFSFLNKNKQESSVPDSGYYSSADDAAVSARARSKRASSAGEPASRGKDAKAAADPVLPEKKRARRRLVGAVALALAVAVGLPMILDSEPKPLAGDIDIRIPSKERALPLPRRPVAVAAAEALDKREQIVDAPAEAPVPARPREAADVKPAAARPEPKPLKVDAKPAEKADRPAVKPDRPAVKPAERLADKPEKPAARPPVKADDKPAHAKAPETMPEAARAQSILEGKTPDKVIDESGEKHVVQVAALASQEKVSELQDKLKGAGIRSYTQKVPTQSGDRIRVLVGPFSKDEAEKVRAKLGKLGLSGSMVRG